MGTFNISNLCQILHSFPYFFITLFPIAFYHRSRMTGRYLIPLCKKLFLRFCSYLPLPSAPLTPSPTGGDSLRFAYFPCLPTSGDGLKLTFFLYFPSSRDSFFLCIILVFFVFSILIFLFSGVKISVFFLKTGISFIFILLLYQLYYIVNRKIFSVDIIFLFPYNQPIKNRKRCFYGKY